MLIQLVVGAVLVCATVVVTVGFIAAATLVLTKVGKWMITGRWFVKLITSLSAVVLWMLGALTLSVWIWAGAFMALGQFATLEEAVYFSVVSFTTLGFGDVVIGEDWRLLSGIIAANGLILFSLVTAFLIEFIVRLRKESSRND